MSKRSIARGTKGRVKLQIVRIHRLLEFEKAFNRYLAGDCSADFVTYRARKMLEVGLPQLR